MNATRAAVNAFIRTYSNPSEDYVGAPWIARKNTYDMRWQYYNNSAFEDLAKWRAYKGTSGLYRHIRSIYNPTQRLVDFYSGIVYPGMLTTDAQKAAAGMPVAIPLSEDAPAALRLAIAQIWKWSNWQSKKSLYVRFGAALGDVLTHVVDDVNDGMVYVEVLWPGMVTDLDLDTRGNVQMYEVAYQIADETSNKTYTYKRRVDIESICTFRNDEPWSYDDVPAEIPNPYGFVPACWTKHRDVGEDFGDPAMRGVGKIDELNSLASMVLDNDRKILTAPVLVKGKGFTKMATTKTQNAPTDIMLRPELDQGGINFIQGPSDADFKTLDLPEGEAMLRIESLLAEIEKDHPELGMYKELRAMSNVTGPGAARLFGDVETYVSDAKANYDTQSIRLFGMAVAIAGYRANDGSWPTLTKQQTVFKPFDLTSFAGGYIDFSIDPRPLIQPTEAERLANEQMRMSIEMQKQAMSGDGMTAVQQNGMMQQGGMMQDSTMQADAQDMKAAVADERAALAEAKAA